jgi:plasmid replication initiation protein
MKTKTRYENTINTIPMRLWTSEEQDFFFGILTQLKDEKTNKLTFDKYQLKEFANYANEHHKDFFRTINSLSEKILSLRYREETTHSLKVMVLFTVFDMTWNDNLTDMSLTLALNPEYDYILNQIELNYTDFPLEEFTQLRSTYAKTMYRYIKQWRKNGRMGGFGISDGEIPKERLFEMLAVPASMQRADNFKNKVLKPIIDELTPLFEGLKVKPIKARKVGNPIIAYKFSWKQEHSEEWVDGKYEKKQESSSKSKQRKVIKPIPEWTDEAQLQKLGIDTSGMTQNEMYHLATEKGLHEVVELDMINDTWGAPENVSENK